MSEPLIHTDYADYTDFSERRVGNRMIQRVFIAEQDGNTPMLLNELAVAHHLKDTPYRYNGKIDLK